MRSIVVVWICTIILNSSAVQSNYFLGGTISWKVQYNTNRSSIIPTIITQSYQWKNSVTNCNDTLKCVNDPSVCGGFQTLNNCVDDSPSTQILNIENLTENAMFCIAFQSQYWSDFQLPKCNSNCSQNERLKWSIGSCLNLNKRSNGNINSSPVTNIVSPIRIPMNSIKSITIPIVDTDNDNIRCRWAMKKSSIDECGDFCRIIPGSSLNSNNCTLTFDSHGKTIGDIYGIALIIEDFLNSSTTSPLSSIPLQFLIEITNISNCLLKPQIYSNMNRSTTILVGQQFNFNLTITQGCSNRTIIDLMTVSPLNMIQTNLTYLNTENVWKVTQTWIPSQIQLGAHVYCVVATDNLTIQSDEYCLEFHVVSRENQLLSKNLRSTNDSTTTAPAPTVTQTVLVQDPANFDYDFSKSDLALALGLSLPLLFLMGCLFVCRCCCQHTACYRSIFSRQNQTLSERTTNQIESNENSLNNLKKKTNKSADDSRLPDYRQQYVNQTPKSNRIRPNTEVSTDKKRCLTANDSFPQKSSSHFDENSENRFQTTLLSPSVVSFANSEVSFTKIHSIKNSATPKNQRSILVRAYEQQENQKA